MPILLDTCAFLWMVGDVQKLSAAARTIVTDPANRLFLSAVSSWEIALKYQLRKLRLPDEPEAFVTKQRHAHGIEPLPLVEQAALILAELPMQHRDPFDRMLICQARRHRCAILTPDAAFRRYDVDVLW
jgi:PIN domain nuclease of toxin-antitoxin system